MCSRIAKGLVLPHCDAPRNGQTAPSPYLPVLNALRRSVPFMLFASLVFAQEAYPPGTFELTPTRDLELVPTPLLANGELPDDIVLNLPVGFKAQLFSAHARLSGPRFMGFDAEGVLHVATMRGPSEIVALPDRDGDGFADEAVVVASGFRRLHSLAFYGGYLYAADTDQLMRLSDEEGDGFYEKREHLAPLPAAEGDLHPPRTIVIDERREKIFVNVGSLCDLCREQDPERAAVLMLDLDGSNRQIFASGLRNAMGLALHPVTNELWAVVNGHDREGNSLPPERIDIIRQGGFYGWPFAYAYRSWVDFSIPQYALVLPISAQDSLLVEQMPRPVALAPARMAPMGIHFYTSELFPPIYHNAAFITFRAGHNAAVPGWKVVVLFVEPDGSNAALADFMTGLGPLVKDPDAAPGEGVRGQPVGVISDGSGNLYVTSDFVNNMVIRLSFEGNNATAAVEQAEQTAPASLVLDSSYPNPFNASTIIPYALSSPSSVELSVYDVAGQRVRVLVDETQKAGHYWISWDGRDDDGAALASGVYFYRLRPGANLGSGGEQLTRKLLLLR